MTAAPACPTNCKGRCATFPLSLVQQAIWAAEQLDPGTIANHIGSAAVVLTEIDPALMGRAVAIVGARHPMLTATFDSHDGVPSQTVHADAPITIEVVDARGWTDADVRGRIKDEGVRRFNLASGPLVRFTQLSRDNDTHVVILRFHHLIADMWSAAVVVRELAETYALLAAGDEPATQVERTAYAAFVAAERRLIDGPVGAVDRAFWTERLGDVLAAPLPGRFSGARRTGRGARLEHRLNPDDTSEVHAAARRRGSSRLHLAVAALQVLLAQETANDDVVAGTIKFNRASRNARTVGCFIQPVALRTQFAGVHTVADVMDRVAATMAGAAHHESYPLAQILDDLRGRSSNGEPLLQAVCSWQRMSRAFDRGVLPAVFNNWPNRRGTVGDWPVETIDVVSPSAPYDLSFLLADDRDEVVITLEYSLDAFAPAEAGRLADRYVAILRALAADPATRLDQAGLSILTSTTDRRVGPPSTRASIDGEHDDVRPELLARMIGIWQSVFGGVVGGTTTSLTSVATRCSPLESCPGFVRSWMWRSRSGRCSIHRRCGRSPPSSRRHCVARPLRRWSSRRAPHAGGR